MATRRTGRGLQDKAAQAMGEQRIIASAGKIRWKIYDGPLQDGTTGRGFVPDKWGAYCIPLALWNSRDSISQSDFLDQVNDSYRFLRFHQSTIKRHYDPIEWDVEALPNESNPQFGEPVERAPAVRDSLGLVQFGREVYTETKDRINALRSFTSGKTPDKQYARPGDTWFGRLLEKAVGGFGIFDSDGTNKPLLEVSRETANINSGTIKTSARPRDMIMGGKQQNALSETTPSTAVIPIQQWLPYTDSLIAGAAILNVLMRYFNATNERSQSVRKVNRVSNPTVYVDLDDLRREQHQGEE